MTTSPTVPSDQTPRVRSDVIVGVGLLAVAILGRLAWHLSASGLGALAGR